MRRYAILLPLLASLLLTACHCTKKVAKDNAADRPQATAEGAATLPPKKLHSVVNFEAIVEGISVNGQARIVEDSAIWASAYKLIEVGRVLATTDSVWIDAPMFDIYFAGTYADVSRRAKRKVTFDMVQAMLMGDNAEAEIAALAREAGYPAKVKITSRKEVESLRMPFTKRKAKRK